MPFADAHGQRIYFEDSGGSGPPLLLGHGLLMDHTMFDRQVAALAPAIRVIRWDARGHGRTEWDGGPFTYWDSAADGIAVLDHLGIDRAVIGGMSQGGFQALRAALSRPERVKGLALIATQAGVDDEETRARYQGLCDAWVAMGAQEPIIEIVAGLILGPREHWEPWVSRFRAAPRDRVREAAKCLIERDDITARIPEITCPALVFHGTEDAAIIMDRAEQLARLLPGCERLVRVEGGAHAVNLTHPDEVNGPLAEFVQRRG